MTHQAEAIKLMTEVLDRAAIRDSNLYRGYRRAAILGAIGPKLLDDPNVTDEHKEWLRARLADLRAWLHDDFQALVDSLVSREDWWDDIARVLDPERAGELRL